MSKECMNKPLYAFLLFVVVVVSFLVGYSLPKKSFLREGDLYINEKVDEGDFWKVRGSWCGCCGSDFAGWLYASKSFNLTIGYWYHITVYGDLIVDSEGIK